MNDRSLVTRDSRATDLVPAIPLNFVYSGLSAGQIMAMVRAHWKLGLSIFIVVLALTVVAMKLWPRTYTAVASLMVNFEVNDPLNGKDLPTGQIGSYIATQVELMQTPELLLTVVDRLNLASNSEYASGFSGEYGTVREWVAASLGRRLAIYQGRGSQLIYVNFSASTPAEAALLANTVAEVYQEQDLARSTGLPGQRAQLYAQQLEELRGKVDQAQQDLTGFHQRNGLVDEGNRANLDVVLLAGLEDRLMQAQNARRVAEAMSSGDQTVSDKALASTEIQSLKARLVADELRLAQLELRFTSQNPDIQELKSLMATTRGSLAAALQSYSSNASGELGVAQQLEQSLQRALARQRTKVLATGKLHAEAAQFRLDLDAAQDVYKRALEGYDQLMFASGGNYSNVALISRATPPVRASAPRVKAGLFLGGVAAIVLALAIPLLYELLFRRVRSRADLEHLHGVPVLVEFRRLTLDSA